MTVITCRVLPGDGTIPGDRVPQLSPATTTETDLERLLRPRSVAIVGVSGRADSLNARPLRLLREHGFDGAVYPVNPRYDELQGVRCYPSLEAIGEQVDLVLVLVPAAAVADVVTQAGAVGAVAAVVFGSGFAETGLAGRVLQDEIVAAGRAAGVRVLGPNCQGIIYRPTGLAATFTAAADRPLEGLPGVAYVGQSGAVGGSVLDLAGEMGLGLTAWISTGNQADLDLVEIASLLVHDDEVRVVLMYAESIADGAAYTRLASRARDTGTALVVLLSGRSEAGRRAAASHTGSMLGDDIGFVLASQRYGVTLVDDVDDLLAVGASLARGRMAAGPRMAVVTTSGGAGSLAADHAAAVGLQLPPLSLHSQEVLARLVPDFGAVTNPVDVTAQLFNRDGSARAMGEVCTAVAADPEVDMVAVILTMVTGELGASIAKDLVRTADELEVPLLVAWLAGTEQTTEGREIFRSSGMPVFGSVGALARTAAGLVRGPSRHLDDADHLSPPGDAPIADRLAECAAGTLPPDDLLDALGVAHPAARLVHDRDDATRTVEALGGTAVMKIQAGSLTHKSDVGGVRLGVVTAEAAVVHDELDVVARANDLEGYVGIQVQQLVPRGVELILGITSSTDGFPPVVTVGMGGVNTELYRDVVSAIAPVDAAHAGRMLRQLRGWPLLDGFRGAPPVDVRAAAEAVVSVSRAFDGWSGGALELEINPLIVAGQGAVAVDLLVSRPG
jgi:acyl-CoA synthetase (NDP forming)